MFIKRDKSDEMFYRDFLNESEKLQAVVEEGKKRHYAFEDINQDIFTMLYEPNPQDVDAPTPMGLRIAKQNLDQMKELREYQDLHRLTRLDPLAAGFATESMAKHFIKQLPEIGPESPEDLQARKDVCDELNLPEQSKAAGDALANMMAKLKKIDPMTLDGEKCRQKVRGVLQQALADTQEALDALGAFGQGFEPGQLKQVNLKEKMELAKKLRQSNKIKEIAKLAGRFVRIAKKKQKEKMISNVVSSVQTGDNLARTLPSELGKLANPLLAPTFFKSFAEKGLLEYKLHGKVPQGQGPVIVMIDGSGSMSGHPEMASKAIALALLEIARAQKRDFILAQFGSEHEYRELVVTKGQAEMLAILAELEFFFDGGTDFQRPLSEAVKHISGSKFNKADVIFITDGCAHVTPEFMEQYHTLKKAKQFSCLGVLIGHMTDAYGAPEVMKQFCDEIFASDDLLSEETANADMHERMFKI